ncbi:MAG: hypothetical protein GY820_31845 [Gammaproteobacteria bacterium]|nr:hypothetical protein [Gammaproteobacteria bacterium]
MSCHVVASIIALRVDIIWSSLDLTYLQCLDEVNKRFAAEIQAYHLLIKTPRAKLDRVMRHINGVYTQRHIQLKQTDGSLFRGRYKAILIDTSAIFAWGGGGSRVKADR